MLLELQKEEAQECVKRHLNKAEVKVQEQEIYSRNL